MRKLIIIGACALTMAGQAHAGAAVIAATTAITASAGANHAQQEQQRRLMEAQRKNAPKADGGDWAAVGWLYCPAQATEATGCKKRTDNGGWGARDYNSRPEPWIDWMKRHKGDKARLLGLMPTGKRGDAIKLFYGVKK